MSIIYDYFARCLAGSMLPVPLHARDHGQREGREAEAVAAPRSAGQGAQVKMNLDRCVDLSTS